uniref:tRNA/rRNA methyltransferase SpoU type domain-containing protein n=1 Tax=Octactis speculum TaxID=3111310 RepID=A0A7S2G1E4_9STRA|mmetsp:Transcript_35971/g.48613  ORF Transcript_35971/g.48613 Transcript_35971/m.48613 type:complete len:109 (+) Transcript_35971:881-1207(+)
MRQKNLPRLLENARQDGWRVVGTALSDDSIPLEELKPGRPTIVVLGNEGHGLRTNVRRACDVTVRIARGTRSMKQKEAAELGDLDSLNVSVSGGILLHHLLGNIPMTD